MNRSDFLYLGTDKETIDVVILYPSIDNVSYVKMHATDSREFPYVRCKEDNCELCNEGSYAITKMWIPVYNIKEDRIQFWDRSSKFMHIALEKIFNKYPDPSRYVFRITRHGVKGDLHTFYELEPIAKNDIPYEDISIRFSNYFV